MRDDVALQMADEMTAASRNAINAGGFELQARRIALIAVAVTLLALPWLPVPEFWITQLNLIGLYAIVALGLVLLTGVGGLTSFGQAAFVGVGAYATAVLTTKLALSPWLGLLAGVACTLAIEALDASLYPKAESLASVSEENPCRSNLSSSGRHC